MSLELYHYWRSSCSWRLRWALHLKGVAYESIAVNLLEGAHRSPDFLAKNPAGMVPAIKFQEKFAGESVAILEWLEETYPNPPLLPQDTWEKLQVRQLVMTIAAGTQPLQNLKVQKFFSEDPAKRVAYAQHWIKTGFEVYEALLNQFGGGKEFSIGTTPTMADLCLIPQVYNAVRFKVDLGPFPLIKAINEKALATPECDRAAPHNQPGAL